MTTQSPQTIQPIQISTEQAILMALRQRGLNRGELSDQTGFSYQVLVPALTALLTKGLIESYFQAQENLPVLTYRLRSPAAVGKKTPPPPPFNPHLQQP